MCDRSKEEVLARELCIAFYRGMAQANPQPTKVEQYTDTNWGKFMTQSQWLLSILDSHDYEKDKK